MPFIGTNFFQMYSKLMHNYKNSNQLRVQLLSLERTTDTVRNMFFVNQNDR